MQTSQLTQAPMELTVAGKAWRFSPLNLDDLGRMETSLKAAPISAAMAAASQLREAGIQTDADTLRAMMDSAMRESAMLSLMVDAETAPEIAQRVNALMSTPQVMSLWLWLSLRHEHKDLTIAEVSKFLQDAAVDGQGLVAQVLALSGMQQKSQAGEGGEGAPSPKLSTPD